MRHSMNKPRSLPMKILVTHIADMNKYLSLFPGSKKSKNMEGEELNKMMSQMRGQNRRTSKAGNLKKFPTRKPMRCSRS